MAFNEPDVITLDGRKEDYELNLKREQAELAILSIACIVLSITIGVL
jgi:hypothetical protein|uniref:Uncharacterized protein n=1 Tax=viral metagenome TaxID=1070528 RepID=A0A6C0JCH2_9ZZZZ|tara:strand:- start:461 stop:601 length:141 start_codon:yes stop_codon:yes gene_type:complete